jgi:hypothetical protein
VVIETENGQVEVVGEPLPLEKAIRVVPEEQAANMKEFMEGLVQGVKRQR